MVAAKAPSLDARITAASSEWPADRLGTLERNILRIGIHELEEGEVPAEVAINEAALLAKRYATDDAARLANGIRARAPGGRVSAIEGSGSDASLQRAEELLERLGSASTRSRRMPSRAATSTSPSTGSPSRSTSWRRRSKPRCNAPVRPPMQAPDDLARLVESVRGVFFHRELGERLLPGCATRWAVGGETDPAGALPRHRRGGGRHRRRRARVALALELVHSRFVHDDLPAMDDDDERRGRPSARRVRRGRRAPRGRRLLGEALRLALLPTGPSLPVRSRRRRSMIMGSTSTSRGPTWRSKTSTCSRRDVCSRRPWGWGCGSPTSLHTQPPWRAFGEELGVLFQAVDDVIDGDGYAAALGVDGADVAASAAGRAHVRLGAIDADTSVLAEIVDSLAVEDLLTRDSRWIPPDGIRVSGSVTTSQPSCRAASRNAKAWRRPGSAIVAGPSSASRSARIGSAFRCS